MTRNAFIRAFILCLLAMGTSVWAQQVSQNEAMQRAQKFFAKPSQADGMKKAPRKAPRMKAAEVNDAYYIFNDEANGGFVIVSGEERTPDILGYSNGGRFDTKNVPVNMRAWLDGYKAQIKAAAASTTLTATSETYISRTPIAPLLRTEWNQRSPFNLLCPMDNGKQCVTGCVATAMAQVMNYWQHPAQTTAAIPNRVAERLNFTHPDIAAGTAIDWANMPRAEWEATTETQQKAVSELMLYCGMAVQMDYGANSSAAYSQNVAPALANYFGYDANYRFIKRGGNSVSYVASGGYNYEDWLYVIYNELRQGHPVYYSGQSSSNGHAFVCDGYASEDYYHIDWGWGGAYNGFFRLSVMNPEGRGTGGGSSRDGYASDQDAIIGVKPAGYIDKQPAMACRSIKTNQTSLTRNSIGNFPTVTITPELFATTACNSIDYALTLWQNEQQLKLLSSANRSLQVGESFNNGIDVVLGEEIPDGEYQIIPVCRRAGESAWLRCLDSDVAYIKAVISGEMLTLTPMDYTEKTASAAKLICTASPVITGTYHYTDHFNASFTIRNDGEDYTGPLCIINSTTQDVLAEDIVSIAAGETKTVTMTDIIPWSIRTDNTQNHFYMGSYIGDVHISGSEFALSPFPRLRITTNIPDLPEAEEWYGSYWIYDTKLNTTLHIEYPEPDGYAPTVNGRVNVQLAIANSESLVSTDLDVNLQPGQSVELPINIPDATMEAYYNHALRFSVTPVQQENSKRYWIENNGQPDYAIIVAGGKKVPGIVNFTVDVTPEGAGSVNVISPNSIVAGSEMSVTAEPFMFYNSHTYYWDEDTYNTNLHLHINHFFSHWTKNGQIVSEDPTLTLTMNEDCALVAHFKPNLKLTCIDTPVIEGTREAGSDNTYNAVIWNESEEDYEGDIELFYSTEYSINASGYSPESRTATTHVAIKAGETQAVSIPFQNIASANRELTGSLSFSHPKMPERECWISGSDFEIPATPQLRATFTVLNADANQYIDSDSLNVSVRIEKAANSKAYSGPLTIQLMQKMKNGSSWFGEQTITADLTSDDIIEQTFTFHSGNSQTQAIYGEYQRDLHFQLPSIYPDYYVSCIGDGNIYHLKTDWGTRGEIYVYASSKEGGTVGLKDDNHSANEELFFSTGMTAHAHATPATGYYFRCWTDKDGNIVSREANYTFVTSFKTAGERYTLKANFEKGTAPAIRTITTESQPFGQGSAKGGGQFYDGESVTLTATANKGYEFICWQSEDGTKLSTNATYTFTVSQDATCTAIFAVYENLTITAENKSMTYGDEVPELTYKVTGQGTLKGEPGLQCAVRSTSMPGTYDIIVTQGTLNNRRYTLKNGKFTVRKATLTAYVEDATMNLGDPLPDFVFTLTGFIGDDTMESTFTTLPNCYVSGGTPTKAGTYIIKLRAGTSAYYTVTQGAEGTLTVLAPDAVGNVQAEQSALEIFTISGMKVKTDAQDIKSLPAGVYIINGKKVVVGQ
ncbi:MAG: C10 family peptidase [Bacteroidaceae bacterium]|nr:C10 family peptidase [Bacteroidaceae bacterium]